MNDAIVVQIMRDSIMAILLVSAPLLGISMLVGLIISIFQTTTSIQEQTLTFVPKIMAVFGSLIIFGPWMIRTLVNYTFKIFTMIHKLGAG